MADLGVLCEKTSSVCWEKPTRVFLCCLVVAVRLHLTEVFFRAEERLGLVGTSFSAEAGWAADEAKTACGGFPES